MYWKEKDALDYLISFILFYLYSFLQIADDRDMLKTYNNYYNLNLLKIDCKNSYVFGINIRIFYYYNWYIEKYL